MPEYLARIERSALKLWEATAVDAFGRPTTIALGNNLTQTTGYKPNTGMLDSNEVRKSGALLVSDNYYYDKLGNVSMRSQNWSGTSFNETFAYDDLNRLKSSTIGAATKSYNYDAAGNLILNTGASSSIYTYPTQGAGAKRPHAVQSIPGIGSFIYDDNGNLTSGAGRSLSWTSFDMPSTIQRGSISSSFVYGPEHQRTRQTRGDGSSIDYAGSQEVEQASSGTVTVKTYWPNGIGVEMDRPTGTTDLYWFHKDRLGSPIAISDINGNLQEPLAYDAWGKRRTPDGSATPDTLDGQTDNKGYTGHEMLDQLDLIHMNGRVYDPLVARFVSADPHVTALTSGQSYNRYSYVWNNPLGYTDPTGFDLSIPSVTIWGRGWVDITSGWSGQTYSFVRRFETAVAPVVGRAAGAIARRPLLATAVRAANPVGKVIAAAEAGYAIGTVINNATGASDWLSDKAMDLFGPIRSDAQSSDGSGAADASSPGTKDSDKGCIYCVPGDKTSSGNDYIGSTDNLDQRKRDKSDGRDREGAQIIGEYDKGNRDERRNKEQQAINDHGGVGNLDNRRNEVRETQWPDRGITPPGNH